MPFPFVERARIRALSGLAAFERGTRYFEGGMVLRVETDDEGALQATVRGSGAASYRCTVELVRSRLRSRCTCPVHADCKHVVAAMLANNAGSATAGPSPAAVVTPAAPDWRAVLASPSPQGREELALGLELRARAPHDDRMWAPRPYHPVTPRELSTAAEELQLAMRPLLRSRATGAWIQGDASWDGVRRAPLRFGAEAVRWFSDLLSIARDSLLSGTAGDWLIVDRIGSGLLWPLLEEGRSRGIPLVATQKHTDIVAADGAEALVRARRTKNAALALDVEVRIDGATVPRREVHAIGGTGVYAVHPRGSRIVVTLASIPLTEQTRALLRADAPVEVSQEDRASFLAEAYPGLVRGGSFRADGSLRLPPLPEPEPVLRLVHGRGDVVDYSFAWRYPEFGVYPFEAAGDVAAVRDPLAERHRREEVESAWAETAETPWAASGRFEGVAAAEFLTRDVPVLEAHGVAVTETGARKDYAELTGDPLIAVRTVESTDPDWFDLGVLVSIDGKSIPFEPLFAALSLGRKKLLLVDGSYFSLAHPALDRLRDLIDEAAALGEEKGGLRISRYQLTLWEDFEDLADEAEAAVGWRAAAEGLRSAAAVPELPTPSALHAELREYQEQGFRWLAFLWAHRLGGILADDMGLGKTLQLLSLVVHAKAAGEDRPFLVIAPTSVLPTWAEEAARFAPGLRIAIVSETGKKRAGNVADLARDADVVVTSYAIARLDEAEFAGTSWAALILDEAQFVKNPATRLHRAIAGFSADTVFAVTGTPLENSLSELWALLSLTAPGLFPSARRFRQEYIQPIEQGKVPENAEGSEYRAARLARLRRRIRPLMLRRTKEGVAADLPAKQEQLLHVDLAPAHRARYDAVLQRERQKVLGLIQDLDRNRFIVFRSLTVLRMMSLAPGLVDDADLGLGSRKLDVLVERIAELEREGHRVLVFSQFTSYLRMAGEKLAAAGLAYAYLDGATRDRRGVIDGFRSGAAPVFLISLKAGGFGITLTEADYVFLLDPWWNPAAEAQAIDRTHRIGQRNPVMVYRMIATDTIEEKVLALQRRKARLFSAVMDDDDLFARSLTAEDIRGLFDG